jgi:hypothetical protein
MLVPILGNSYLRAFHGVNDKMCKQGQRSKEIEKFKVHVSLVSKRHCSIVLASKSDIKDLYFVSSTSR